MFRSWRLGRIAGIDLYLHPTFLLLLALTGASQGGTIAVALMIAVFGCVLLHELGHALTARLYGIPTEDITLYPIGGVARLRRMPRKPGPELLIALAGPAVNLAIAGGLRLGLAAFGPTRAAYEIDPLGPLFASALLRINLMLAAFNLIPAFPLDGGRVLRALLSGPLGRLRATEIAAGLGQALALGFAAWSLLQGTWLHVLLAAFVYFAGQAELARVRVEERGDSDPDDFHFGRRSPARERWVRTGRGVWVLEPVPVTSAGYEPCRY